MCWCMLVYAVRNKPHTSNEKVVFIGETHTHTRTHARTHALVLQCSERNFDNVHAEVGRPRYSVTIGGARSGEAKFCYCVWLQDVFPGPTRVLDANGISIASVVFAGLAK